MDEVRSAFKTLTDKPTEKRPVGRRRHSWENNVRMALKETGVSTRNLVDSADDRDYWRTLVNAVLKLRFP